MIQCIWLAATIIAGTTPSLEVLISHTQSWQSSVASVDISSFDLGALLAEDECVQLVNNSFADTSDETLRTVACTDKRVVVLTEGEVTRTIALGGFPVFAAYSSPSGRYVVVHAGHNLPSEPRAMRINTETGEKVEFSTHPDGPPDAPWLQVHDDGSTAARIGDDVWLLDEDLNLVGNSETIGLKHPTYLSSSENGQVNFVFDDGYKLFDGHGGMIGHLLVEGIEGVGGASSVPTSHPEMSSDGSIVLVPLHCGQLLIDGISGRLLAKDLNYGGQTGCVSSGGEYIAYTQDALAPAPGAWFLQIAEKASFLDGRPPSVRLSVRPHPIALARDGTTLVGVFDTSTNTTKYMVLDHELTPIYLSETMCGMQGYGADISETGRRVVHQSTESGVRWRFTVIGL